MADERTYIRVHDGIEDHPKTAALSDKGFRLLVTTWGWCSRHRTDGRVPLAVWRKRGTPKVRAELVAAGLVEPYADHVVMHDYLQHQRSSGEIAEKIEAKKEGARKGNHIRWHESAGKFDADCKYCVEGDAPPDQPPPKGSHSDRSSESHQRSGSDRKTSPETETETEKEEARLFEAAPVGDARARGASGPNATAAFNLVRRVLGNQVTSTTRTALTIEVGTLLAEATEDEIAAALRRWNQRTGVGARIIHGLVDDIRKEARGATNRPAAAFRPSTTDQRVAAVLALARPAGGRPLELPGAAS